MKTMNIRYVGLLMCQLAMAAMGKDYYVAPGGSDMNPGTSSQPFASLEQAQAVVRADSDRGILPITVHVADGIYYLSDTLVFTPADSGSSGAPVAYEAAAEGHAVLSGGQMLSLTWTPFRDGIFQAATPAGIHIDQLFVNGVAQRMARYPNYNPSATTTAYNGCAADAFSPEKAVGWANPVGGYMHAMHEKDWGGYHYIITGVDTNGNLSYEGGWQNNRIMGMHPSQRMVENIFEELDAPGEWFHDSNASTLYCMPEVGVDLSAATVEYVRLRHLVEFQGSSQNPVAWVSFQGFRVVHAARTFMDTREPLLRSDWTIYRGGAFLLTGTEDVRILDCEFDHVGGNAIFVSKYNRRVLVKGCHIHDAGASGVCFVGDPNAVYNPLFNYDQKQSLANIDLTPGPKTPDYPADSVVEDCLIHGIGRVEKQPAGVEISMSRCITVRDTSIYDCARAGINIGDGCWGGHLIERCDVFDTVQETSDHGSFNSWGRDRYWKLSGFDPLLYPDLPFLDAVETTVIRNSRWRCDHGWDIDLDDGSSNYDIYDNLLLAGGLKFREGFRRHAWNNITVNNGLHPHAWYKASKDQIHGNIFMRPHSPARMGNPPYTIETSVDENLFRADQAAVMATSTVLGWDSNSIFGEPLFINPPGGDYQVGAGSPAFGIGFVNFAMDQFGVKKPALKALARTPLLPSLENWTPPVTPETQTWQGAELGDLGDGEYSAYGISLEDGGVVVRTLPAGSDAALNGLLVDDVIQAIDGVATTNLQSFFEVFNRGGATLLSLKVVRDQQEILLDYQLRSRAIYESAPNAAGFVNLPLPSASTYAVTTNPGLSTGQPALLTDGALRTDYGAVFANKVVGGIYKMDLGAVRAITAITSYSYNKNNNRGPQDLILYGSASETDPGWDMNAYTELAALKTPNPAPQPFVAASLKASAGETLGNYRWIAWKVVPVTALKENTAFQELAVAISTNSAYDAWVALFGGAGVIGGETNDYDGDGVVNLAEYAMGGNPTNTAEPGVLPTFTFADGIFNFVHPKRTDDAGLVYIVETCTNLVSGAGWTNAGYTVSGTNVTGLVLNYVTNTIPVIHGQSYIRLKVSR